MGWTIWRENSKEMKTALIYDEITLEGEPSWVETEYESPETIEVLLEAIKAHCDEVVPIPFGPTLVDDIKRENPGLVFNIAEGRRGPCRESIVPIILEHLGIPYTGSDGVTLGISLNKALTKRLAAQAGVRTPEFRVLESGQEAAEHSKEIEFPVLLKPNFGGSSVGINPDCVVKDPEKLPVLVSEYVARYEQPCLVEQYISGMDVTIGLLGNASVEVLPPGRIVSFEGKRKVVCPFRLPRHLEEELATSSLKIYNLIGVRDLARLDYVVDEEGRAYFLEINPLPGLSPYYGIFPVLARAAGYNHTDLIGTIMNLALKRNSNIRSYIHG